MKSIFLAATALVVTAVLGVPYQVYGTKSTSSITSKVTVTKTHSITSSLATTTRAHRSSCSQAAVVTTHSSHAVKPTIVNVPLTDWIENKAFGTDLQWYIEIFVGNPPQKFNVLVDTGSDLLILTQKNATGPSQRAFDPSKSTTFSWSTNTSNLAFPEADFSSGVDTKPLKDLFEPNFGNWAVDDVKIQGVTAKNFTFMLLYNESAIISDLPNIDGVLGLGLEAGVRVPGGAVPPSLQYALYESGLIESGIFGMYLPSGQQTGGQLTLGGVDETKFEGDLTWISLNRTYVPDHHIQWTTNMETIFINDQQLVVPSSSDNNLKTAAQVPYPQSVVQVLDVGYPVCIAPDNKTAQALYAQISPKIYQIDPNGAWGCSCKDMEKIAKSGAEITFLLGYGDNGDQQLNVTIPSHLFNLGPYPGLKDICQGPINHWSGGVFVPDTDVGLWSLGSNLLKNYYTAWDGDLHDGVGLRVGFAPLKGSSTSHSDRRYEDRVNERQLEPAHIGLGGGLMMVE